MRKWNVNKYVSFSQLFYAKPIGIFQTEQFIPSLIAVQNVHVSSSQSSREATGSEVSQ